VISVQDPDLEAFIVETYSNVLIDLVQQMKPNIILAGATNNGRTLMPHVAMRLHTGLTAGLHGFADRPEYGDLLQTHPAIGGNILATIKTPNHRPQMATVQAAFHPTAAAEPFPRWAHPANIAEARTGGQKSETTFLRG
jgi:electron transfer flavoprotein alpha subunit